MKTKVLPWIAIFLGTIAAPTLATAGGYIAASVQRVSETNINDLRWDANVIHIRDESNAKEDRYVAVLGGHYQRPGWTLTRNQKPVVFKDNGAFLIEAIVTKEERLFEFVSQGPNGETETEKFVLSVPYWERSPYEPPPREFFLSAGIGGASYSVTQTNMTNYSSIALVGKVSANFLLVPKKWDLGFSAYGTLFQITKSREVDVHYLGLNGRVGYILPWFSAPWVVSVYGGWYYATSVVSDNSFGYTDVNGPQIYPTVRYVLPNADVIACYFKFSPVANSLSDLSFSNREFALGAAFIHPLPGGHSVAGTIDFSTIAFATEGLDSSTNTIALGIQYGF